MNPESGGSSPEEIEITKSEVSSPGRVKGVLLEPASQTERPDILGGLLKQDSKPEGDKDGTTDESQTAGLTRETIPSPGEDIATILKAKELSDEVAENPNGLSDIPEKRTVQFIKAVHTKLIENAVNNGAFDENPDLKEKAQLALSYKGEEGNKKSSDGLRANIDVLKTIGDEASETALGEITPHVKIKLSEEEYGFDEWEEKLAQAETPEEKAKFEQAGLYAFEFPEEPVANTESAPETVSDLFNSQKASLQEKIREKEAKGEDISTERMQLTLITYAENGAGDNGTYLRRIALKSLGKSGVDVDRFLTKYAEEGKEKNDEQQAEESGKQRIEAGLLRHRDISREQAENILKGSFDIEGLMKSNWEKYSDLPEIIMGRKLNKDEEKQMMDTVLGDEKSKYLREKYGKNMLLVMLGLLFISTVGAFEVAKAGSNR